jgi:3-dehydroquinate synthase
LRHFVDVGLGNRAYQVVIGDGLIAEAGKLISPVLKHSRTVIITDDVVGPIHSRSLADSLASAGVSAPIIEVPEGEATKSFEGLTSLSYQLLDQKLDRGDVVIALGGGVVGDLVGFAASIYKRGMDFIQIPTTLLAQVDSSVGGKTAIDTPYGKNLIGAFHQPRLVLADLDLLESLPDREMRCGFAEVLKYGLLGDAAFFDWLEINHAAVIGRDRPALLHAVSRSVQMKADIVAEDETEQGRRALLNLGHTFGHAVEAEAEFGDLIKHGEAVGLGMAMAFRFAARMGKCPGQESERAVRAISSAGLPVHLEQTGLDPIPADRFLKHMLQDKKSEGGQLTLILPSRIGDAEVVKKSDIVAVREFLISEGALP